jgi:hypothetical protein
MNPSDRRRVEKKSAKRSGKAPTKMKVNDRAAGGMQRRSEEKARPPTPKLVSARTHPSARSSASVVAQNRKIGCDDRHRTPRPGPLNIYTKQRIQDSDTVPVRTMAPGDSFTLRLPVTVHQGTVSLGTSFTWGDNAPADTTSVENIVLNIFRDGKTVTKGERIVFEETFALTDVTPFIDGRALIFSDRTTRGRHIYKLVFTNTTTSTVSIFLRVINFTITC